MTELMNLEELLSGKYGPVKEFIDATNPEGGRPEIGMKNGMGYIINRRYRSVQVKDERRYRGD